MASRKEGDIKLQHLGFVRAMGNFAVICALYMYKQAKKRLGPMKLILGALESAIIIVANPPCRKLKGDLEKLLLFVDHKVEAAVKKVDPLVPTWAKTAVIVVKSVVLKALEIAKTFVKMTKTGGAKAAIAYAFILSFQFQCTVISFTIRFAVSVASYCGNKMEKIMTAMGIPFLIIPVHKIGEVGEAIEEVVKVLKMGVEALPVKEKPIPVQKGVLGSFAARITGR